MGPCTYFGNKAGLLKDHHQERTETWQKNQIAGRVNLRRFEATSIANGSDLYKLSDLVDSITEDGILAEPEKQKYIHIESYLDGTSIQKNGAHIKPILVTHIDR
jgi:hypothetical protein